MEEWMRMVTEKCQRMDRVEAQFNRWFRFWNVILTIHLLFSGIALLVKAL